MLQEPMHQTKDDKPQCQATTKKGTRAFCVIFLLLLLLCAFRVLRSIDRARLIAHKPTSLFLNTRFSPRRYKNRFCARARSFIRTACFLSRVVLTDSISICMCILRRPVPTPSHGRLQILRATHRGQVKKERGAFRSFREKTKKTRERDAAFFCASSTS